MTTTKRRTLIAVLFFLFGLAIGQFLIGCNGATEPCQEKPVSCARWVVDKLGYCPGVRYAQQDGWRCSRTGSDFEWIYYECQKC